MFWIFKIFIGSICVFYGAWGIYQAIKFWIKDKKFDWDIGVLSLFSLGAMFMSYIVFASQPVFG